MSFLSEYEQLECPLLSVIFANPERREKLPQCSCDRTGVLKTQHHTESHAEQGKPSSTTLALFFVTITILSNIQILTSDYLVYGNASS